VILRKRLRVLASLFLQFCVARNANAAKVISAQRFIDPQKRSRNLKTKRPPGNWAAFPFKGE
jgi:hypothetical protein